MADLWKAVQPHERQALLNHQQTLERLAERGGLGPDEAVAVLENKRWLPMDKNKAIERLLELVGACTSCGGSGHGPS